MVIRPGTDFRHPECMVCRKSLSKSRIWKECQGSLCRRCKADLEKLAKDAARQNDAGIRLPFRFGLFDGGEDLARAEDIWTKPASELTKAECEWVDGVM